MQFNPEQARSFARNAATLLCLDVPPSTSFGIDNYIFSVGHKFKGIKMIPPGVHFISYAPSQNGGSGGSQHSGPDLPEASHGDIGGRDDYWSGNGNRIGKFIILQPEQVIVTRWNSIHEELEDLKVR